MLAATRTQHGTAVRAFALPSGLPSGRPAQLEALKAEAVRPEAIQWHSYEQLQRKNQNFHSTDKHSSLVGLSG